MERQTQLSVTGIADDTGEQKKQKMKKGLTRHSGTRATVGYTPVQLSPCRFFDAIVKIKARKKSREGRTNDPHNTVCRTIKIPGFPEAGSESRKY